MDLRRTAAYRCLSCGKEWGGWIGPTECPYCGHLYVKWLDYPEARGTCTCIVEASTVISLISP